MLRCRSRGGTIGYYTRRGSFCGRTSVHVPKRLTLGLGPPSGVSIGCLSGVGALWDCVSRVCGGGGGCAGGGVPLGAGPCCPDVGRCLSGVLLLLLHYIIYFILLTICEIDSLELLSALDAASCSRRTASTSATYSCSALLGWTLRATARCELLHRAAL